MIENVLQAATEASGKTALHLHYQCRYMCISIHTYISVCNHAYRTANYGDQHNTIGSCVFALQAATEASGKTALHVAAAKGFVALVKQLIDG
jgi:ankyrin repeat protein